ncbi:MAG: ribosomal protein S18-alanine N-acetyltransferase [Mycobacteriaceae bacterium]
MTVEITELQLADVQRCAELEELLFSGDSPWPASAFESELRSMHNYYLAARQEGLLVGYAGLSLLGNSVDSVEHEIHTIGVDPKFQGKGIGRLLLERLLIVADRRAGPVFLEVRTDNIAALALYRSLGFVVIGTRKRYYQASGADAFSMKREVKTQEDRVPV